MLYLSFLNLLIIFYNCTLSYLSEALSFKVECLPNILNVMTFAKKLVICFSASVTSEMTKHYQASCQNPAVVKSSIALILECRPWLVLIYTSKIALWLYCVNCFQLSAL